MVDQVPQRREALFISHATPEDNHFVRWLGAKLTAMGYEVWADVMRLQGGDDWARELEGALRNRAVKVLLVCTPSGLEKQGVRNEIEMATNLARRLGDDRFIVPLRLDAYEAPFRIAHLQYIDFKRSWASGLTELLELLREMSIPRGTPGSMQTWLETHAEGSDRILERPEPLVSNWLQVIRQPEAVHYIESAVGASLERFQTRSVHSWPIVPFRAGVISFARPDSESNMGVELPGKLAGSQNILDFLEYGWPELAIDAFQARRVWTDLGVQAFDLYCHARGLKGFMGTGKRLSWWGDIKTAPAGQVKFDWGYRRGSRQVVGQSGKRRVHWHYGVNAQLRSSPQYHLRVSPRLVFSENGLDAIEDAKRAHSLRRSFAKGWRNARWRDMLCAYLWWMSDGKAEIGLPVSPSGVIAVRVPPMQFSCPVGVQETANLQFDDDDPDLPDDTWSGDEQAEEDEA